MITKYFPIRHVMSVLMSNYWSDTPSDKDGFYKVISFIFNNLYYEHNFKYSLIYDVHRIIQTQYSDKMDFGFQNV
jgi:hypothetical protein